jgi:putative addiction module antidote
MIEETMGLSLKVTTVGNSTGVILPKEALARLKVKKGDKVYLTESPGGYSLTAFDERFASQVEAAEDFMKEYRDVFRELAK